MRLPAVALALGFSAGASLAAPRASANGRFPAANQIVVAPSDPSFLAVRATYGILVSHNAGACWYWLCETATGYDASEVQDPAIAITGNDTLVAGLREGLSITTDGGCSWRFVDGPLASTPIVDVVVRPDAPHTILALASARSGVNDAGDDLYTSQVWISTDDAVTWSPLGAPLDPTYILQTIEVAASDPSRVYVSGAAGAGATTVATLFVSTDNAASWTPERILPWDTTDDESPYISGVDPTDADLVYLRTMSINDEKLLVTTNAGQTFSDIFDSMPHGGSSLTGFALSADGDTVYIGGAAVGLWSAQKPGYQFSAKNTAMPVDMQGLARGGSTLYTCSNQTTGEFIVGSSTDDGVDWSPLLLLDGLIGPLTCGGDASENACIVEWPFLMNQLNASGAACGSEPSEDASTSDAAGSSPDAGNDASTSNGSPGNGASSGCSCDTASLHAGGAAGLGAIAGALGLLARRRRPRARRQEV